MMVRELLRRIRWKTLSATVAPGAAALGLALSDDGPMAWFPFLSCGVSAALIQIGTNLINDAYDRQRGVDSVKRMGPQRIPKGASAQSWLLWGLLCFAVAFVTALPALRLRGVTLTYILLVCCLAGYTYTGGPFPLGYYALGDIAVFAFFGIVFTSAARFVAQGGELFAEENLVAGAQVGCTAVNIMAVNNLRDIDTDRAAGKRTVSNLLGYKLGRWELVVNVVLAHALGVYWLNGGAVLAFGLPLLTLPYCILCLGRIFRTPPSPVYNVFLQQWSALHLVFGALLMTGLAMKRRIDEL